MRNEEKLDYLARIWCALNGIKAELQEISSKLPDPEKPRATKTDGGYNVTLPLSAEGYKEFVGFCKDVCDAIAEREKAGIDPHAPYDPATRHVPRV